jgi:hypothetical protein
MYDARWRLLGYTLRMDDKIPAIINNDLKNIREAASKKRGRKKANIASLPIHLTSIEDLRTLERLANDRKKCQQIINNFLYLFFLQITEMK